MPLGSERVQATKVSEYFARLPSAECVERCQDLIENFYTEKTRTGQVGLYRTAFYDYYEGFLVRGQLYRKGAQGEQTGITVNHYHNLIKHRVTLVCQQELAYEPQAVDGSHKALEQIRLAKGLLNLYSDREDIGLDGQYRQAAIFCELFGEAFISALWDKSKGNPVAYDSAAGSLTTEGDIVVDVHDPLCVVRDVYRSKAKNEQWCLLREEVNKVDLAVMYPNMETDIMAENMDTMYKDRQIYPTYSPMSDIIWAWTLFHDRTPALPNGRMLKFLNERIILEDGPMPEEYKGLPVHRMAKEEIVGSPWGYSDSFDLMPVCNAISRLHGIILSNNLTFGLQHILLPENANITESELGTGLTTLTWPAERGEAFAPRALNLTSSPKESYDYIDVLTKVAGTLAGINEVSRGNPDLVLKGQASGAAMALLSTQSIQFNSDLEKAYNSIAAKVGTAIVQILAKKAVIPRQGRMLAMSGKPINKSFTANDLTLIDKVTVKTGNPLAKTTAGRMQIAESLLQNGFVKNRQDYMQVLETGNLDPLLESYDMEISLIKDENDAMMQGPIPDAVAFDNHVMHIPEHQVLLASVDARKNPQLVQTVVKHIQSHLDLLAGNQVHGPINPILATINNQPALPSGTPSGITLPNLPLKPKPMGAPGPLPGAPANMPQMPKPLTANQGALPQ